MDSKRRKIEAQLTSKEECPVCLKIPRANIFQCTNGHSICDLCSSTVTVCPTCKISGVRIRNRLAESLLDDVKFKCCWSINGCEKSMLRGELSAHEDQCDENPEIMKLCSLFSDPGQPCQYKFTSKWLTETENCKEFLNHLTTSHDHTFIDDVEIGNTYTVGLSWKLIQDYVIDDLSEPALHLFRPKFYRLQNLNEGSQEQVFFRTPLVKADSSGNKCLCWAIVQLTPEVTPIVVRVTINGNASNANSKMLSQWGPESCSTLSWIVKPISFVEFKEMVKVSWSTGKTTSFPFSLPISFVSEYYVNEDNNLLYTITFESKD